jgi:uncharacterized protein with GYD domain
MATYVALIQFTDQGIHNIKDTAKRHDAVMAEAEKMGMKIVEPFWAMGRTTLSSCSKHLMTRP